MWKQDLLTLPQLIYPTKEKHITNTCDRLVQKENT